MRTHRQQIPTVALVIVLAGCSPATRNGSEPPTSVEPSQAHAFPIEAFADLGDEPVSAALAAELQEVLDESAN